MSNQLASGDLATIVGRPGQGIPKLSPSDKLRLREFLKGSAARELDATSRLRASLAVGQVPRDLIADSSQLRQSLHVRDIVANLGRLARRETVLRLSAPLRALQNRIDVSTAATVIRALPKLAGRGIRANTRDQERPQPLDPETAELMIGVLVEAVGVSLGQPKPAPKRAFLAEIGAALTAACSIAERYRTARVCGAALELLRVVERRVGSVDLEAALGVSETVAATIVQLPGQILPDLLIRACIGDTEFLASRAIMFPESRRHFEKAVRSSLEQHGDVLPLASRLWAENYLGMSAAPNLAAELDRDSDLNLERLSALLLSAWEARSDGPRSRDLFELMAGICRTSFDLAIRGQVSDQAAFDPALHEPVTGAILVGAQVRIVRPCVAWAKSAVVRVVIRSLVEPVGSA